MNHNTSIFAVLVDPTESTLAAIIQHHRAVLCETGSMDRLNDVLLFLGLMLRTVAAACDTIEPRTVMRNALVKVATTPTATMDHINILFGNADEEADAITLRVDEWLDTYEKSCCPREVGNRNLAAQLVLMLLQKARHEDGVDADRCRELMVPRNDDDADRLRVAENAWSMFFE